MPDRRIRKIQFCFEIFVTDFSKMLEATIAEDFEE